MESDVDREYPEDDQLMAQAWQSPACRLAAQMTVDTPSDDTTQDDHRRFNAAAKAATNTCIEQARTLRVGLDSSAQDVEHRAATRQAAQLAYLLRMAGDLRHPLPGVRRLAARELIDFDVADLPSPSST